MCYPFLGKTKLISQFCPLKSVRFLLIFIQISFEYLYFPIRLSRFITPRFLTASGLVGLDGLEPSTSRLSGVRSNHLSYRPLFSLGDFVSNHSSAFSSWLVEMMGFEPMTPCLQGRCSPNWATPPYCRSFPLSSFKRSFKIEQRT